MNRSRALTAVGRRPAAACRCDELGRDYDDAVAESSVDRIGAEIDKRVTTR
jgi:hypothetical protein